MARYGFFVLTIVIGLSGLFAAYYRAQKYVRSEDQSPSVWDYVLLWPLLFNKTSADTASRQRRLLTTREIVGWLIVLVLIVVAILFGW
jgi:hypothetical protein